MFGTIVQMISFLDFNGAHPQISFFNNDAKFKTLQGGLLSILIYLLGLFYFTYLMIMWQCYKMPAVMTDQIVFYPEQRNLKLVQPLFVFSLQEAYNNKSLNISEQNREIYEVVIKNGGPKNLHLKPNPPGFDCQHSFNFNVDYFDPICINLNDSQQTDLSQNFMNSSQDTFPEFYVKFCDLKLNKNCLSPELQDDIFVGQQSRWKLTLMTQDLDLQTGSIIDIPQDFFFLALNQGRVITLNFQIKVQKTTYIIDDGIIFSNLKQIEIIKSIDLITTQSNFLDNLTGIPFIATIFYSLDRKEQVIRVAYPKLGQILAEFGFLILCLLPLRMIMTKLNTTLMMAKVEDDLLKMYFPDLSLYELSYDWRGKIKQIFKQGNILENLDQEQFLQLRETLGNQVRLKLNYVNILHELSRIQLLLQMQISRQQITQLKHIGYRLKLPEKRIHRMEDNNQEDDPYQDLYLDQEQFGDFMRFLPGIDQLRKKKKVFTFGDQLQPYGSPTYKQSEPIILQKHPISSQKHPISSYKLPMQSFISPNISQNDISWKKIPVVNSEQLNSFNAGLQEYPFDKSVIQN